MIKKFNDFINEDYFSKLANRKDNSEIRKGNGRRHNPSFLKKIDDNFTVVIDGIEDGVFDAFVIELYNAISTSEIDDCFINKHDKVYFNEDEYNLVEIDDGYFVYNKYREDILNDLGMSPIFDNVITEDIYNAAFDVIAHLAQGIEYEHVDQKDKFILVQEGEMWNLICDVTDDDTPDYIIDNMYDTLTDWFQDIADNIAEKHMYHAEGYYDDKLFGFYSYNNYASCIMMDIQHFGNLLAANAIKKAWEKEYPEIQKDVKGWFGIEDEDI